MAYEGPQVRIGTLTATANYSSASNQYKCVYAASATTFTVRTGSTSPVLGVLQDLPSSGQAGEICLFGVTKARVNVADTIAVGDKLTVSTGGGVMASTAATTYVLGRALESISAATGIITIFLNHQGAGGYSTGLVAAADA